MDASSPAIAPLPAPKGRRLLAHLVDLALALALVQAVAWLSGLGVQGSLLIWLIPPLVVAVLAVPAIYYGATLGQRCCGLALVDGRTMGAPPRLKVWQWAATKQILWLWEWKAGGLVSALFYLPILTDKRSRSLYDDWAEVYVVLPAEGDRCA
jgi:hypothetical protein